MGSWGGTEDNQCAYFIAPVDPSLPVLAFDLDWTAVYPNLSGKGKRPKLPKTPDDWCWCEFFGKKFPE